MDNDFPAPPAPQPPQPPPQPPPLEHRPVIAPAAPRKPSAGRGWKVATFILALLVVLLLFGNILSFVLGPIIAADGMGASSRLHEITVEENHSHNKIAVIPVEGIITSQDGGSGYGMVELIEDQLKLAAKDDRVKAVLLKVNSPGGEVLASDDIYNAIVRFQKEHDKPVIASMSSLAASGGYYVSAPCRWIVANELTITGSIGVIMHAYNYRGLMNKVGLRPMVFKSGRFKDMLSGEKDLEKLSPEEKAEIDEESAMINKLVIETFDKFKSVVAEGRKASSQENSKSTGGAAGRPLSANWERLADGRILSGKEAYEHGFVDELGGWRAAIDRAEKLAGIDDADLVTYQVPFNLGSLFGFLGKAESRSIKLDLGLDMPQLKAGLYYLSSTFVR